MPHQDSDPPVNRQDGAPIGHGQTEPDEPVATGDRREEMRYEADEAQLLRVRHTFKPDVQRPPQEHSKAQEEGRATPPVEDVAEVRPSPSVWDARPADR